MAAPLVVGFDLDLTLVDSRPGIAAAFRELSARTGAYVDIDTVLARLGQPLDVELASWFDADAVPGAAALFREIYPLYAVTTSPALPGAAEAFAAVRERGGRVVVITGKFEPNARLHLAHLGLVADAVVGWAWAEGKVVAMAEHGASVYVGDHPADMIATRSVAIDGSLAPAAVGVLTGEHSAAQLQAAGAHVVLTDLTEFPGWLTGHLPARPPGDDRLR